MKKIILSLVLLFSVTTFANYDPIINIPDPNFKAKLLAASPSNQIAKNLNNQWFKIDTNNDGEIQISETQQVGSLLINSSNISNLEGILNFINLQYLECKFNQLTSLNFEGLINFRYLYCDFNQLTNINIQGCNNLINLYCNNNQLFNLNIQNFPSLKNIVCNHNLISTMNVENCTNLEVIYCDNNQITNLNIQNSPNLQLLDANSNQLTNLNMQGMTNLHTLNVNFNQIININVLGCVNLFSLNCTSNQITSLNVQGLTNLQYLRCNFNQLTNLDLQELTILQSLNCDHNQLTSLFIKNGFSNLNYYSFSNNNNLQYICCSNNQLTQTLGLVNQYGYTNCQVNSYCSFTPGGNFNTISGQLKYDANQNGCDANDEPMRFHKILFSQGTNSGFVTTNNQGNYSAYVGSGTHTITPQIENPTLFNISPPSAQITFPNSNNNTETQNFCITPNGNQTDVEVVFLPLNPARPGFDADYKIVYRNIGNQVANGEVSLSYMNDRIDLVSSSTTPTSQTANQLLWSYQNLLPFETRTINLRFNVNSPTENPPVNNGDVLNFTANMTPVTADINPANNNQLFNQTVVGSYDPNDKTCLQGSTPAPTVIGEYVHYLIRFENTGTFFAENVVVRDDIDLTKFDINSLVVLDASHDMLVTRINGNRVEFIFEGIVLPFPPSDFRHGYVLFKIKTKSTLIVGNTFSNQASIYFDYNWPIITNDEVSTISLLGQPSFEFSEFLSLYPNPANDMINVSAKAGINLQSIEIYNTMGQLLMALPNDSNERSIDVSHLNSGTYMISVNTDKGKGYTKFIKK